MSTDRADWRGGASSAGTVVFFFVIGVLFTWPAARFDSTVFHTRQFDLYGVLWMIRHAREVLFDGFVPTTNWPLGETAARPDAYLMTFLALMTRGILSPLTFVNLLVLLGPIAGALAAEWCAVQGFGVRRPWSWLAGLAYGFNGLAATAWLEGHVYFLFDPWLPLLLLSLVRGLRPGAPWREGVKAGGFWILALATSAYSGIVATLLVVAMGARRLVRAIDRRAALYQMAPIAGTFLPFGVLYILLFLAGTGQRAPDVWRASTSGVATLAGLISWWPGVDGRACHSINTPLGFVTLFLAGLAPILLRNRDGWRVLLVTAATAVALSFGPTVSQIPNVPTGIPGPLALLDGTPVMTFFHFPVRLLWIAYLCGGIVAARVADELARQRGTTLLLPVLAMAGVDAIAVTGAPFRATAVLAAIPSAYQATPSDRAVLDLFAGQPPALGELPTQITKLTTYYHTIHGRPVLAAALPTHGKNCRDSVAAWLMSRLVDPPASGEGARSEDIEATLAELGIGAVAVHTDLFPRDALDGLLGNLRHALGPPAVVSHDGGESITLFVLRTRSNTDPAARYRELLSEMTVPLQ